MKVHEGRDDRNKRKYMKVEMDKCIDRKRRHAEKRVRASYLERH